MKRITFLSALSALLFMGYCSNAKGNKIADAKTTDANASPSETNTVGKAQAGVSYYWFDANNGQYISHTENSGCDESTSQPCAVGYTSVSNPSNPQKPNRTEDADATGERP